MEVKSILLWRNWGRPEKGHPEKNGAVSIFLKEILSTVTPYGLGISYAKHFVLGTHSGVGVVSVEGELLDSVTGQRLAAVVDRRASTKENSRQFI